MPQIVLPTEGWLVIGAAILGIVALAAIARGRGMRFLASRGDSRIQLDLSHSEQDQSQQGQSPAKSTAGLGDISNNQVMDDARISGSKGISVNIGHQVGERKDG